MHCLAAKAAPSSHEVVYLVQTVQKFRQNNTSLIAVFTSERTHQIVIYRNDKALLANVGQPYNSKYLFFSYK